MRMDLATIGVVILLVSTTRSFGDEQRSDGGLPESSSPPLSGMTFSNRRIGHIEVPKSPDFDVTSDPLRKILHLVWRDAGSIKHAFSKDGGAEWSPTEMVVPADAAGGPRIAVDSRGRLHLVYGVVKAGAKHSRIDGRTFYTALTDGNWSPPEEALIPASLPYEFQVLGPRIAVDGRDNVHVIAWMLASGSDDWQMNSRCAYSRKPATGGGFEQTLLFSYGRNGEGGARYGDLVTDAAGDVHIFFASHNRHALPPLKRATTTHFVRHQDGRWGAKVDLFCSTATDFGMSAAVDGRGVIHIAGQDASGWSRKNPDALIHWSYFNNAAKSDELKPMHRIDDDWEYGADLLLAPNGDIWMSRGNWQQDGPFPWLGRYARRDATTGRWTEPENVSAAGFKNADSKYGQVPKFVFHDRQVHLFYAEQAPGEAFKFQQRTFAASFQRVE